MSPSVPGQRPDSSEEIAAERGAPGTVFLGSKGYGLDCLRVLHRVRPESIQAVVTLDDRSDARSAYDAFEAFCAERSIPHHVVARRREAEALLAELSPRLCFVVCWYWLIPRHVREAVPQGFVGIHNSLLPKYRGGAPLVWQLIQGEERVGSSVFRLDEGVDDGAVWAQVSIPVSETSAIGEVQEQLKAAVLEALETVYPDVLEGRTQPTPQDESQATYCAQRRPDDGEIDWGWSAKRVFDFVRAQSRPYPGAFTHLDGKRLTVWRARLGPAHFLGTPGQVARTGAEGVVVIAGDHAALVLEEVELDGQAAPAGEVIRSLQTRLS